ncbi:hypothetical protein Tdes44962_MAKER09040 [Teratosphaeria destructans]|uniref:Glycine zipper 2TM domain-containing protein n=1 Tax=Teratosphaeria destructans TaxID=418781 RepID=A0A9W7W3G4_9PEZI|nr:hypothetical protein Tdes44962_MAKER09040 [Teratosphaeria destructans]
MASSTRSVVGRTYDDPRANDRARDRRVQEIPFDQIDAIGQRELAVVRPPRPAAQELDREGHANGRSYAVDQTRTCRTREWADANGHLPPYDRGRHDSAYYRPIPSRRRDKYHDRPSDDESSRERRRDRSDRRARSQRNGQKRDYAPPAQDQNQSEPQQQNHAGNHDDGLMWYSMKARRDGNLIERTFDSSYDGLLAAGAGAAIGIITARRFGGEENHRWKALGGAVIGAAAFNAIENQYRIYTEEKMEMRGEREENAVKALGPVKLP